MSNKAFHADAKAFLKWRKRQDQAPPRVFGWVDGAPEDRARRSSSVNFQKASAAASRQLIKAGIFH